jgi:hypothetical protein
MKTTRIFSLSVLGLVLTLLVATASAAEYYTIVDNFGKKPRMAFMDVSGDTTANPIDVLFDVYDAQGVQLAEFNIRANSYGLASSSWWGNFFDLAVGQPMLVRARTADTGSPSEANLHIDSLGAPTIVGVSPIRKRDLTLLNLGTYFGLALGNFRSASLLIANLSGDDVTIDVFKGTRGAYGNGSFSNPHLGNNNIWKVGLTQNEALSNLIVTSTGPIIVQVVIDDGRTIQSFMVLPLQ